MNKINKRVVSRLVLGICIMFIEVATGQIIWQKTIGGEGYDELFSMQATRDQGFVLAGLSLSATGDIPGNFGGSDVILLKLDSLGDTKWIYRYGGSDHDYPATVIETTDGGFLLVGSTSSNDYDVDGNHGNIDGWVLKVNNSGAILWQKCFGGSKDDELTSIVASSDGGYLLSGYTDSSNGDIVMNQGQADFWLIKIDTVGNLQWSKTFGGEGLDRPWTIVATEDGGCVVAGETNSEEGDVAGNHGSLDAWVMKINWEGKKVWQKCLGGTFWDRINKMIKVENDEYVMVGFSASNNGVFSENNGKEDSWVVKMNDSGDVLWQRLIGGSMIDKGTAITTAEGGDYWVTSVSRSNDGDVTQNKGSNDVWVVKLSSTGELLWEKSIGGSLIDWVSSVALSHDEKCVIAGYTWSQNGDVAGPIEGEADFWVVKLDENVPSVTTQADYIPLEFHPNPSQHRIFLQLPLDELMYISISDCQGRVLQTASINARQSLDISALPSGAYVLSATAKSGQLYVGRFVKE